MNRTSKQRGIACSLDVADATKTVPESFTWARLTDFSYLGQSCCLMRKAEPSRWRTGPLPLASARLPPPRAFCAGEGWRGGNRRRTLASPHRSRLAWGPSLGFHFRDRSPVEHVQDQPRRSRRSLHASLRSLNTPFLCALCVLDFLCGGIFLSAPPREHHFPLDMG